MITKGLTFIHIKKILKSLNVLIVFFFVFGGVLLAWQALSSSHLEPDLITMQSPKKEAKRVCDYEKIGSGALKVSSELKTFPLPDLKREMRFLGKNTRPDSTIYDLLIHVGLKESGQSLKVVSGQKLYLTYAEGAKPYLRFSQEPTPLWLMPHLSESGDTLVELGVRLLNDDKERLLEEKKTFEIEDLLLKESPAQNNAEFQEAMASLGKANRWGPDCLFDVYGGGEYAPKKMLQRLEFQGDNEVELFHVKEGDTLLWQEGHWILSDIGKNSRGCPLARLKAETPYHMEWELWSADGLEKAEIKMEIDRPNSLNFRAEEIFSRIRQRTASRISCRLGNKATILREGDWVLKTKGGWRVLKSLSEIEDVLSFHLRGELFVFDGIVKQDGQTVFTGTYFDEMRTQKKKLQLPFALPRQGEHSPHSKKAISTKIRPKHLENKANDKGSRAQRKAQRARKGSERIPEA